MEDLKAAGHAERSNGIGHLLFVAMFGMFELATVVLWIAALAGVMRSLSGG